ncbi:hypothetical protein [Daejeonella sp. JGW-45]|uniref:hypothetical protein n=1 Tax=Daejeonella sp. JGW-45 TaxID=3034148 RepID=UPI0023EA9F02|nr:hypothetical protein [Daejeonella sp. JGW-45]
MKVIDYFTNDVQQFDYQKPVAEVERIVFEKFDWLQLEQHLSNYQKSKLLDVLYNHGVNRSFAEEATRKSISTSTVFYSFGVESDLPQGQYNRPVFVPTERKPIIETHQVEFNVYFSDAYFMLGYVTFTKSIKEVGDKVSFKIKNDYILAEFENVKSWFAKKLKTRKFKVNATITTTDGKVTEASAISPHIAMIDAELIDSIKYQRTIALTKSPRVADTHKSLFTAEEIFGEMETEGLEGNVFCQNEQDILNFLLDNHKTRNRKQLEFLSGSKQAEDSKLRFTLHPNFGFLFFIQGKDNNHFVWELLNSHATYMWSIDKSEIEIELQYKRIEASVNTIRDSGREQYKRAYRQNHHDSDLLFCVIEHDDISSNFVDGFVKWKHKLNEKIT